MNEEKIQHHVKVLKDRKKELDKLIEVSYNEWTDDEIVNQMKIKKLKLKDEIAKYEKMLSEVTETQ